MKRATTALVATLAVVLLGGCSGDLDVGQAEAEAELPRLAAGLVDVSPGSGLGGTGGEGAITPADGVLRTPHSAQRVLSTWTTDEIDAMRGGFFGVDEPSRPAEGEEFVVVQVSARDLTPTYSPVDAGTVTAVVVAGVATPVELFSGYVDLADAWSVAEASLLVSAPVDAPVLLSVTDAGKTASIDLRTGERVDDEGTRAGAVYYRPRSEDLVGKVTVGGTWTNPGYVPFAGTVTLDADADGAFFSLQPWTPALGWAPEGRVWGLAQLALTVQTPYLPTVTIDPATVFTLTPAGGQPLAAAPGSQRVFGLAVLESPFVSGQWDLPPDFTVGTLDVALRGTWTTGDDVPWDFSGEPTFSAPIDLAG